MEQEFNYKGFLERLTMSELWLLLTSGGWTVPETVEEASALCLQLIENGNNCLKMNVKSVQESRNGNALVALCHQPSEVTKERIQRMFTRNEDVQAECGSIRVSIDCPVGKTRLVWPCRSTKCQHLQCFDGSLVISMHQGNPLFNCPVCNMSVHMIDLRIDIYFLEVLQTLPLDAGSSIDLNPDGSWTLPAAATSSKELVDLASPVSKRKRSADIPELIILSDDDDDEEAVEMAMKCKNATTNGDVGSAAKKSKTF